MRCGATTLLGISSIEGRACLNGRGYVWSVYTGMLVCQEIIKAQIFSDFVY